VPAAVFAAHDTALYGVPCPSSALIETPVLVEDLLTIYDNLKVI
jgi:hypothetical protein